MIDDITKLTAYHYYEKNYGPLACLSSIPYDEAIRYHHKGLESEDELINYMKWRKKIESMMLKGFVQKGGKPMLKYPYYFTINNSERIKSMYSSPEYISLPIKALNPDTVSFTYHDSFLSYSLRSKHPTRRKIYTINEMDSIIRTYGIPKDPTYIEMQVWDIEPLIKACE